MSSEGRPPVEIGVILLGPYLPTAALRRLMYRTLSRLYNIARSSFLIPEGGVIDLSREKGEPCIRLGGESVELVPHRWNSSLYSLDLASQVWVQREQIYILKSGQLTTAGLVGHDLHDARGFEARQLVSCTQSDKGFVLAPPDIFRICTQMYTGLECNRELLHP